VELDSKHTLHISKIKQRIMKIVSDEGYRSKYLQELDFPIEKHYSNGSMQPQPIVASGRAVR